MVRIIADPEILGGKPSFEGLLTLTKEQRDHLERILKYDGTVHENELSAKKNKEFQ